MFTKHAEVPPPLVLNTHFLDHDSRDKHKSFRHDTTEVGARGKVVFFNLHSGGWNQGPLDTAAT
jgi:hypothetical protein